MHDRDNLQAYLDNACNSVHLEVEVAELASKLSVYPNPTKDFAYVKNLDIEDFEYEIHTFESKLIKKSVANSKAVDFTDLPTGLYILKIKINNELHSFRVVKE